MNQTNQDVQVFFNTMNKELEPMLDIIDEQCEHAIHTIKQSDNSLEYKRAIFHKINSYRSIRSQIKALVNPTSDEYTEHMTKVFKEFDKMVKKESHVNDIIDQINTAHQVLGVHPPQLTNSTAKIYAAMQMIKMTRKTLDYDTYNRLIDGLNEAIRKRNKVYARHAEVHAPGEKPPHGIVMQLTKERKGVFIVTQVAAILHVKCKDCENVMQVTGNSELDIYAPAFCSQCNSTVLHKYQYPYSRWQDVKEESYEAWKKIPPPPSTDAHIQPVTYKETKSVKKDGILTNLVNKFRNRY